MRLYTALAIVTLLAALANGQEAVLPASAPATTPVRDAASFRPRANVDRLIQGKRTQDEDKLRIALLDNR